MATALSRRIALAALLAAGPGAVAGPVAAAAASAPPPQSVPPDTAASEGATGEGTRVYRGDAGELEVPVPRLEGSPVRIDGVLDEEAWGRAAVLTGFTQYEPVEGAPPAERTEVLVFYTEEAIHFGIRAFDRQPAAIQATVGERDRSIFNDDWIRLTLDTFDDQRRAYLFYVNPLGIQTDGLWVEGLRGEGGGGRGGSGRPPVDFNPDFLWESRGRVTGEGWVAEIRIPFVSLRFARRPVQTWGFNVAREVRRLAHKQSWAPLTKNVSNTLAQSGHLVGLRQLSGKKLLELNPVTTGKVTGERTDGEFRRSDLEPEFGLNARYGITRNLTLGGTFNPDFSQVEADVDRITVNERFAIFFPEKRLFFLEGSEIFESPTRLVHTRQIADPLAGLKLTGKVGSLNLAYLAAVDESPVTLGAGEHDALFNLARVRKDVGAGSTVGFLYTDRTPTGGGGFNRVAAADARLLLGGRHTLTAQVAGSWTRPAGEGAETEFAPLVQASLARSGRDWGWEVRVEDVAPNFRTESGFIRRTGDLRIFAGGRVTLYNPPGAALERYGLELRFDGFFDHPEFWSGRRMTPFEREEQLQGQLFFRGDRFVGLILGHGYFRFQPASYADYRVEGEDGALRPFDLPGPLNHLLVGGFFTRSRITAAVQVGGMYFFREVPIFSEAARGRELLITPSLNLRPTASLSADLSYALSRIWRARDGSLFSKADIPRLKLQYQFSRALFFRGIVQYDLERRDALRDPGSERPVWIGEAPAAGRDRGRFLTQLLLSYEPSPGTIFFIGWSREEEGSRGFGLGRMEPVSEGLFAKLSYLYRF